MSTTTLAPDVRDHLKYMASNDFEAILKEHGVGAAISASDETWDDHDLRTGLSEAGVDFSDEDWKDLFRFEVRRQLRLELVDLGKNLDIRKMSVHKSTWWDDQVEEAYDWVDLAGEELDQLVRMSEAEAKVYAEGAAQNYADHAEDGKDLITADDVMEVYYCLRAAKP